ncbi:MAG: hypothetical protein J7L07_06150 [Candidatus Odinarchaeota archaeon]|nr:hypothetical protein [Candidatus Odinarchaeota archaeon]
MRNFNLLLRSLIWKKEYLLRILLYCLIAGFLSGPFGYDNPFFSHIVYIVLSFFLALVLLLFMLTYEEVCGELPKKGKEFLEHAKRDAVTVIIFIAVTNIFWTIVNLYVIAPWINYVSPLEKYKFHPADIILLSVAILALYYQLFCYLIYGSVYMDINEFLAKMKGGGNPEKGAITGITLGIGLLIFLAVTCIPLFYVKDVLAGKEHFPYPDLLLNLYSLFLILFATLTGRFLMRNAEKHISESEVKV